MKTLACWIGLWAAASLSASGQDFKLVKPKPPQTKERTAQTNLLSIVPRPTGQIAGHPVAYGGFAVEMAKAKHPAKLLSLKAPPNVGRGDENLSVYPGTERPQGVVLFSIRF